MKNISRKVKILWRLNTTFYGLANKKYLVEEPRRIGSADSAVNAMLAADDEMKVLLPGIIGVSANSPVWEEKIQNYWHSLSVDVPHNGKELETGFSYDFTTTDKLKAENIKELNNKLNTNSQSKTNAIKDDNSLAKYVEENIPEEEKYKYGKPINTEHYLLWRYCLNYSHVANEYKDVDKSKKIRFYLADENQEIKERRAAYELNKKATAEYVKVMSEPSKALNLIYVLGLHNNLPPDADETDMGIAIQDYYKEHPSTFLEASRDKHLSNRATIERLIAANIFKRIANTGTIVDYNNPEITIGNDIGEAINFLSNDKNKAKVSEYMTRLKNTKTK